MYQNSQLLIEDPVLDIQKGVLVNPASGAIVDDLLASVLKATQGNV